MDHLGAREADPPFRIAVLTEGRYLAQPQPAGLVGALQRRGHDVRVIVCDGLAVELQIDAASAWWDVDVAVARGCRPPLPTLLDYAEAHGVPVVNTADAIRGVTDRAAMAARLATAGVPTPTTVIGHPNAVARASSLRYPVICKPVTGDNCQGLRLVRTANELALMDWPEPVAVVQPFLPTDGFDVRLYGIGSSVFAVHRAAGFPVRPGASGHGEPMRVTSDLRALALRCARLFGLSVYSVDCVVSRGRTVVLEVNDFPSFTDVPGADEALAAHVLGRIRRPAPLYATA